MKISRKQEMKNHKDSMINHNASPINRKWNYDMKFHVLNH